MFETTFLVEFVLVFVGIFAFLIDLILLGRLLGVGFLEEFRFVVESLEVALSAKGDDGIVAYDGTLVGKSEGGSEEVVVGAVGDGSAQKIHVGQLVDRQIP